MSVLPLLRGEKKNSPSQTGDSSRTSMRFSRGGADRRRASQKLDIFTDYYMGVIHCLACRAVNYRA